MNIEKAKRVFPSFFKDLKLPEEAKNENIEVYRICSWGKIDKEAFLGTYECVMKGLISIKDFDLNTVDPKDFSTSCFENKKFIQKKHAYFSTKDPSAILAKGETESTCGPCLRTFVGGKRDKGKHVDWWIYENSNPHEFFTEVTESE